MCYTKGKDHIQQPFVQRKEQTVLYTVQYFVSAVHSSSSKLPGRIWALGTYERMKKKKKRMKEYLVDRIPIFKPFRI